MATTTTIPNTVATTTDNIGTITTTATVTAEGLALPPAFMVEQNLQPGAEITVTIAKKLRQAPSEIEQLIEEMCGMFAGGPSMTDELLRQRREDELRSTW